MFHKALWLRNYKQGKVVIWLLWGLSLYNLPIVYLNSANNVATNMEWFRKTGEEFGYHYSFTYSSSLLLLGGLTILLACLLLGGERSNQGMDAIFAMPFKRKDIFLSKWLIGAVNITAITLVNMVLMYIIQNITIHGEYQTFTPFLQFFLVMFISLLAVYSLALFMGTITGEIVSQALLTIIACFLPIGLHTLVVNAIGWHVDIFTLYNKLFWKISNFFTDISLASVLDRGFWYDQWDDFGRVADTVNFNSFSPTLTMYIAAMIYLIASFLLGLYLFEKSPSENSGKIILYKKLEPIFLWGVVICIALLGGRMGGSLFWNVPLIGYYVGLVVSGVICYKIMSRLMKKPLKFKKA